MFFTTKPKIEKNEKEWHRWFAWYPVPLGGDYANGIVDVAGIVPCKALIIAACVNCYRVTISVPDL